VPEVVFSFLLKNRSSGIVRCVALNAEEFVNVKHEENWCCDKSILDALKGFFIFVKPLLGNTLFSELVEWGK
jgi:hypothetical protein